MFNADVIFSMRTVGFFPCISPSYHPLRDLFPPKYSSKLGNTPSVLAGVHDTFDLLRLGARRPLWLVYVDMRGTTHIGHVFSSKDKKQQQLSGFTYTDQSI